MILFKILWSLNALTSLVVIYFFFVGLGDGTVSGRNMGLWLLILLILAAVMLGSLWLKSNQHPILAVVTLCTLAVPSLLYGLFMLVALSSKWN